jgi:hypothetical protein
MSDFLRNLASRALGTAGTVQPRIPSLFEPYRNDEGPYLTRAGSRLAKGDGGGGEEAGGTDGVHAARGGVGMSQPHREPAHPGVDVPLRTPHPQPGDLSIGELAVDELATEGAEVRKAGAAPEPSPDMPHPSQPRETVRAPRVASLRRGGSLPAAQPGPAPSGATGAEGARSASAPRRGSAPTAMPLAAQRSEVGRASGNETGFGRIPPSVQPLAGSHGDAPSVSDSFSATAESATAPSLRRVVADVRPVWPRLRTARTEHSAGAHREFSPTGESPVAPRQHPAAPSMRPLDRHFLRTQGAIPAGDRAPWPKQAALRVPAESRMGSEARRANFNEAQSQNSDSRDESGIRQTMAPMAAVRPPVAHRVDAAKTRASTAPAEAEPAIQVTIGTVEVRAVFPEKPAPRAPLRRPKPGVSLDEYLKRSSRGPR